MALLRSEKVVVSAPMSFAGSSERIWHLTEISGNTWVKWMLLAPIALSLILAAWAVVAGWYFLMYVLFGLFFIPYRLVRRSQRKNKKNELQHRELLETIKGKGQNI